MQPSLIFVFVAFICSSCCEDAKIPAPPLPPPTVNELPPPVLNCGHWSILGCPGSRHAAPVSSTPIEHASSIVDVYTDGGRRITDTLERSGFIVTQEYDKLGIVREVNVQDPQGPLGVRIQLDSNGTIRTIDTLRVDRETNGFAMLNQDGWRFGLNEKGRVQRGESGVVVAGKVVRSIE